MTVFAVLLSLVLFQIKHYLADYHWQSTWMLENKARYGHPGGIVHSLMHAGFSLPALIVAAGGWFHLLGLLLIAEFVIHYHIDWAKVKLGNHSDLTITDQAFWRLAGQDQLAHQLTYLAMIAAVFWLS